MICGKRDFNMMPIPLRHSFAGHLFWANCGIQTIQELLGHSDGRGRRLQVLTPIFFYPKRMPAPSSRFFWGLPPSFSIIRERNPSPYKKMLDANVKLQYIETRIYAI
jgi:hypothetical protein